jgi:PQQ enzyme repeat
MRTGRAALIIWLARDGQRSQLFALDAASGKVLWKVALVQESDRSGNGVSEDKASSLGADDARGNGWLHSFSPAQEYSVPRRT